MAMGVKAENGVEVKFRTAVFLASPLVAMKSYSDPVFSG